ncbi:MAG TPA: hypothetical protein VKR05_05705 [Candidatus Cybelea sp.]|nr:hypothetical protein [Candidatus Cybelea sp.]
MRYFVTCLALVLLGAGPIDQLDRFSGTWHSQGTFNETPYSTAGTSSATTICNWSADHLFMICPQSVTLAGKRDDDVAIYSYDDAAGAYRFFNVRPGRITSTTITVNGNTVTYPFTFTDTGKNVTIRTLNVWKTADLYTWRTEYTIDGGATWTLMASGTSQKIVEAI